MLQKLRPWMLPIAMLTGFLTHDTIGALTPLAPWLIFVMLLITFCKVRPHEFRLTSLSLWLLAVQVGLAVGLYAVVNRFDSIMAQGLFICVFCPTATAAPVITGMLGGSVPRVATFSIVSNVAVALLSPLLFPWIGGEVASPTFGESIAIIASRIGPLVFAPLVLAFVLRTTLPKVHGFLATHQSFSFYIWAVSLTIVVGTSVSFAMSEPAELIPQMLLLAAGAGVMCVVQFVIGRVVGRRCGDRVAGAQSLGQKNTVLAIWMALSWMNPLSSIAPAAYIAWQNTINSLQLYRHQRR